MNSSEVYRIVATGLLILCGQKIYTLLKSISIYWLQLVLLENGHIRCFDSSIFKVLLPVKGYVHVNKAGIERNVMKLDII